MPVTRVTCPHCHATFNASPPVPEGKTIKCPRCAVPFQVTGEATPAVPAKPRPVPGQLNLQRLAIVAGGALLFLGVGASLGAYCFSLNHRDTAAATSPNSKEVTPGAAASTEQPLISLPEDEQAQVDQAIIRGVRYLKTTQQPNGCWPGGGHPVGHAALPGLVLVECGLPPSDPTVHKAADFVRTNTQQLTDTYDLALAILFLDLLGDTKDQDLIQTLALRLVAGQTLSGGWSYQCPLLNTEQQLQLLDLLKYLGNGSLADWKNAHPEEEKRLSETVRNLSVVQNPEGIPQKVFENFTGDNSNTQFAILALWAARRHEVPIDRTVALVVKRYRTTQDGDGSWHYNPHNDVAGPWPTMTCAGLLGLAIGQGVTREGQGSSEKPETDAAVEKGFNRIGQMIDSKFPRNKSKGKGKAAPKPEAEGKAPLGNLYFMWSMERVAVVFNRKTIADKDWYGWGARMLLDNQDENSGHWQNGGYPGSTPVLDTSLALLFLKQANLAKDLTSKLQLLSAGKKH